MKSSSSVFCPHCSRVISKTLFFQHKRLYYSRNSGRWSKERVFVSTSIGSSFSLGKPENQIDFFRASGNIHTYHNHPNQTTPISIEKHDKKRTKLQHQNLCYDYLKCITRKDQKTIEQRHGIRYSCLIELPYFDCSRMCIVDPMHNLLLGTAKK